MKGRSILGLIVSLAVLNARFLPVLAQSQQYLSNRQSVIQSLRDGNYLFCSKPGTDKAAGMCFRFRKSGIRVVGDFYEDQTDYLICITGRIKNNIVNGQAVEKLFGLERPLRKLRSASQVSSNTNWDRTGYLKIDGETIVNSSPFNGFAWATYRVANLNFTGFYEHSTNGTNPPPKNCNIRQ